MKSSTPGQTFGLTMNQKRATMNIFGDSCTQTLLMRPRLAIAR